MPMTFNTFIDAGFPNKKYIATFKPYGRQKFKINVFLSEKLVLMGFLKIVGPQSLLLVRFEILFLKIEKKIEKSLITFYCLFIT